MENEGLSISVRLRRLTTETTHVSVPITEELTCANEDGTGTKPDVDKIIEAALQMARLESTGWEREGEPEIRLHPEQTPPNRERVQ